MSTNESSLLDSSSLDDSITFSSRFDLEETMRQIKEQENTINSHMTQYSKYLETTPSYTIPAISSKSSFGSSSSSNTTDKKYGDYDYVPKKPSNTSYQSPSGFSTSEQIEALMRDFRNEVREIDNSMQSSSDTPTSQRFNKSPSSEYKESSDDYQSPFLYNNTISTPSSIENAKNNKLTTEALPISTSKFRREYLEEDSKNRSALRLSSQTNIFEPRSETKDLFSPMNSRISQTSSPVITFSTEKSNRETSEREPIVSPIVDASRRESSVSTLSSRSEMSLRIENIQLKDEISKLNATVASLQTRMEGMEKNMRQLFELLLNNTK